jgi:hypothetical protein
LRSVILRQPERIDETLAPPEVDRIVAGCKSAQLSTLVLQKISGGEALRLVKSARAAGIRTVLLACDVVDNALAQECDQVIVVSEFLRNLYKPAVRRRIEVLDDPLEVPERFRATTPSIPDSGRLRAVYLAASYPDERTLAVLKQCAKTVDVTIVSAPRREQSSQRERAPGPAANSSPGSWSDRAAHRLFYVRDYGWELLPRVLRAFRYAATRRAMTPRGPSRAETSFAAWHLDTVFDALAGFQLALIPIVLDSNFRMAKSANRLGTLLALGLPTVASPLPAYRSYARHGRHVLFAGSAREWDRCVTRLDADRAFARALGRAGQELAWNVYALERIVDRFCTIVGMSREPEPENASRPDAHELWSASAS